MGLAVFAVVLLCTRTWAAPAYVLSLRGWSTRCSFELYDMVTGNATDAESAMGSFPWFACGGTRLSSWALSGSRSLVVLFRGDAKLCGEGPAPKRVAKTCVGEVSVPQFADERPAVRIFDFALPNNEEPAAIDVDGKVLFVTANATLFQVKLDVLPLTAERVGRFADVSGSSSILRASLEHGFAVSTDGFGSSVSVVNLASGVTSVLDMANIGSYGLEIAANGAIFGTARDYGALYRWDTPTSDRVEVIPRQGDLGLDGFGPTSVRVVDGLAYVWSSNGPRQLRVYNVTGPLEFVSDVVKLKSFSGEADHFALLEAAFVPPILRCPSCATDCAQNNGTVATCPLNFSCQGLTCSFPPTVCDGLCTEICGAAAETCAVGTTFPLSCKATCGSPLTFASTDSTGATSTEMPQPQPAIEVVVAVTVVTDQSLDDIDEPDELQDFVLKLADVLEVPNGLIRRAVVRLNDQNFMRTDVTFEVVASRDIGALAILTRLRKALDVPTPKFSALKIVQVVGPEVSKVSDVDEPTSDVSDSATTTTSAGTDTGAPSSSDASSMAACAATALLFVVTLSVIA
jgi:hypothetical protein